jgi:hypothetical protein
MEKKMAWISKMVREIGRLAEISQLVLLSIIAALQCDRVRVKCFSWTKIDSMLCLVAYLMIVHT